MRKSAEIAERVCMVCNAPYIPSSCSQKACSLSCRKTLKNDRAKEYRREDPEFFKEQQKAAYRVRKSNNNISHILGGIKNRAKKKNIRFDLIKEDIRIPDICPVLKTPFVYNTEYALSIDRVNPSKGYIKDNIQVMSLKANIMKNNATPEELLKFADWVYDNYKKS